MCIVKNGQLKVGDLLFQQENIGKARAIFNSEGQPIAHADPSTPIEILGLVTVPEVGSSLYNQPHQDSKKTSSKSLPTTQNQLGVNIILKTDVAGSLEAILSSLPQGVNVVSSGTGDITETDIAQAGTSKSRIIGFAVKANSKVSKLAEVDHVTIKEFKIIYELLEYITDLLAPKTFEKILGKATVLAEFKIDSDRIAGCKCLEGTIAKSVQVKLVRGEQVIGVAKIKSLRMAKSEVPQVKAPNEFGLLLSPQLDFKISDSIISFETHGTP
jgi:translation initiation factor IF-2